MAVRNPPPQPPPPQPPPPQPPPLHANACWCGTVMPIVERVAAAIIATITDVVRFIILNTDITLQCIY
jgi:hypothetical protein